MTDDNAAAARTPADFLKSIKGKPVVVKLNSGVDYRGMVLVSGLPIALKTFSSFTLNTVPPQGYSLA